LKIFKKNVFKDTAHPHGNGEFNALEADNLKVQSMKGEETTGRSQKQRGKVSQKLVRAKDRI